MKRYRTALGAGLLALAVAAGALRAQVEEVATVESATEVLQAYKRQPLLETGQRSGRSIFTPRSR